MRPNVSLNLPGPATMIFIAAAILLLPWLGETAFNSKGEPREAIVAVTMLNSGDWLLPLSYGSDLPYKPPFMAWIIAAIAWLFNGGVVNEFISRLPSALAAIAMVMAGYHWAEKARGVHFAMAFSLVTLTCVEVFRAAVACRLDMVLTACMVIAIYMLYNLTEHKVHHRWLHYLAIILLLSCATMTKGPVGALLPCLIMGIYRLLRHRRFFPTLAAMLTVALASMLLPALWYYAAYLRGGDEFLDLMYEENIGRLTGTMSYDSHVNPWYYNFMTLAAGMLPWTLLALMAIFGFRRNYRSTLSPAALLSIVAAVTTIAFYCIPASKRSVYLLPAYPFICYGIASILMAGQRTIKTVRFFTWFIALLAILIPIAVIASQFVSIHKLYLDPLSWWNYIILLIPLVCGIAWICNRHSHVGHLMVTVWSLFLCYAAVVMPMVLNPNSNKDAAIKIAELAGDAPVVSYGEHRMYTFNFYLNDRLRSVADIEEAAKYPAGTVLIIPGGIDTTGISQYYDIKLHVRRGSDYRRPLDIALKKTDK